MEILIKNFSWMGFNLSLAFLALIISWAFLNTKNIFLSLLLLIFWILFLPNTIYLITDLQHIYPQWKEIELSYKPILIAQYFLLTVLGIVTFIASMYPINKAFHTFRISHNPLIRIILIIIFNLFIAFALILGKFERTHSWYVFTDPKRVLSDVNSVLTEPILFSLVIFFSIVINLTYFAFKRILPINNNNHHKKRT